MSFIVKPRNGAGWLRTSPRDTSDFAPHSIQ